MWIGLLLGSFAEASTCEFVISRPPEELAVHSELSIGGREVGLARGSLLRVWRGTACGDRAEVEVLGVPYFYRSPSLDPVEPGASTATSGGGGEGEDDEGSSASSGSGSGEIR